MISCPTCGGNLKFNISAQQLRCEHCDTQMDPYAFDQKDSDAVWDEYDVTIFSCPQCGGKILSTDTSAAEFCSFCGASTILYPRISKEKRPQYIIPFQKSKEDCKQAYLARIKRAPFLPDAFKDPRYIDGFRGIYMPYWMFHLSQKNNFKLRGAKTYRRGDYVYTDHYALEGELDAYYNGLSYDASSSFDDAISEKIAPFDIKQIKPFTPGFLSGFYADTADVDASEYQKQAEKIAYDTSISRMYGSFSGLQIETIPSPDLLKTKTDSIHRSMFPVWFMSYRNGDRVAYTTINGQTGRIAMDLPIDPKKYLLSSLFLAIPIFLLLNLFLTVLPTTVLTITAILAGISMIIYFSELAKIKAKEPVNLKPLGLFAGIASIAIWVLLLILQPASDLYYYGGAILGLLGIFLTIKDIISYYNIMATRRLPQFDRKGGDDRA